MKNLKLELGGITLIVAAISGNAFAQDPAPAADDAAPTKTAPAATPGEDTTPISCPVPNAPPPSAQPVAQPVPPPAPVSAEPMEAPAAPSNWIHDVGLALSIGGGVDDFVGDTMRNTTAIGGSWTARLSLGTRSFIAGEASYIGSAQRISALGLANNSELIGNGAQAVLRLNGTIDYVVQPFIYGGAAWRHYSLNTSSTNFSDVRGSTDAFEVPVGIGVAGYFSNLMLDVRGEYRFGWTNHDLITGTGNPLMDRWGVTGNLGYAF
jgi:hypothetical protein